MSFSVTICFLAAAPSEGRPIFRFGLRFPALRGVIELSVFPKVATVNFRLTLSAYDASIIAIVDLSTEL